MIGSIGYYIAFIGGIFWSAITIISFLFFHKKTIEDSFQRKKIDYILSKEGYCSTRRFGIAKLPDEGFHCLFVNRNIVIVHKTTITVNNWPEPISYIYIYGRNTVSLFETMILGKNNIDKVNIIRGYAPTPGRMFFEGEKNLISQNPLMWQKNLIDKLMTAFTLPERSENRHTSVLISGEPGTGKSTIGPLLAKEIQKLLGIEPDVLIAGSLLTANGVSITRIFEGLCDTTPIIYVFDEIDSVFKISQEGISSKDGTCPASNKTSMLDFMENMYNRSNAICIYTTNMSLDELNKDFRPYVRPGRIEFQVTSYCDQKDKKTLHMID